MALCNRTNARYEFLREITLIPNKIARCIDSLCRRTFNYHRFSIKRAPPAANSSRSLTSALNAARESPPSCSTATRNDAKEDKRRWNSEQKNVEEDRGEPLRELRHYKTIRELYKVRASGSEIPSHFLSIPGLREPPVAHRSISVCE